MYLTANGSLALYVARSLCMVSQRMKTGETLYILRSTTNADGRRYTPERLDVAEALGGIG